MAIIQADSFKWLRFRVLMQWTLTDDFRVPSWGSAKGRSKSTNLGFFKWLNSLSHPFLYLLKWDNLCKPTSRVLGTWQAYIECYFSFHFLKLTSDHTLKRVLHLKVSTPHWKTYTRSALPRATVPWGHPCAFYHRCQWHQLQGSWWEHLGGLVSEAPPARWLLAIYRSAPVSAPLASLLITRPILSFSPGSDTPSPPESPSMRHVVFSAWCWWPGPPGTSGVGRNSVSWFCGWRSGLCMCHLPARSLCVHPWPSQSLAPKLQAA